MFRNWLRNLNILLAVLSVFFGITLIYLSALQSKTIEKQKVSQAKKPLPPLSFIQKIENYSFKDKEFLGLKFNPISLQLPDLRTKLIYYGRNSRPDASEDQIVLHFDFQGGNNPQALFPGKLAYLCYDPNKKPCGYSFSPDNKETALWLLAEPTSKGVTVSVRMKGERGTIATPESYAQFDLEEKERPRFGGQPWQMGKWRADGSLFARQRARWYGKDQFLEEFGGPEYAHLIGKHRIDFAAEGEEAYSVYVGNGDMLVWEQDRWKSVVEGVKSIGKPLLVINKIEDRIMNCDLWDPEGKQKVRLNLLKSMESWLPQNLEKHFRFVGAHTRSQYAFEVNKQRMVLAPDDWLVHTTQGWVKLETLEQIDKFVNRHLAGTLFVFEGIITDGTQQLIEGRMFNSSRTESKDMKIPIQKAAASGTQAGVAHQPTVQAMDDDGEDEDENYEDDKEFSDHDDELDEFMLE